MLRGPSWRRLLPDVYVHLDGYREDDHRMWCDAVALTLPAGAAISGLSAAFLWGVDLLPRASPVFVTLPGAARRRSTERVSVDQRSLAAQEITRLAGLPVTTGVRTAFDLGRQLPRADALVAVDALLHRRVLKLAALGGYLDTHSGWPGTAQLREVLTLAEPLTESPMETRVRLVLHDAGLPALTAQHDVYGSHAQRGRVFLGRVDLAYPRWRIAIEYEGDHHRERSHFQRDVARLNALRAAGWLVLRFTADDILRHPARIVRLVTDAIDERRN
ncbi:endonuclease domain-containing protein [Micromonospora sp. CPCC 205561]|uniref:endonuclease domain-containing protein n=1 Tax=Micromonospora sp. CPCC 205561 TaxID=3122407 RepID=UPI002FEFC516